ncbi:MAG: SIS domain-containing protein [Desulfurococcaceae archaeon]
MELERAYLSWPEHVREVLRSWGEVKPPGERYAAVIAVGMGGSGIVGDYLRLLNELYGGVPILVQKSHRLPAFASKASLVLSISYSGNTHETLQATEEAARRGLDVVAICSGGKLCELAEARGFPAVHVRSGLVPRASLASMLYGALSVLASRGLTGVTYEEAERSVAWLEGSARAVARASSEAAQALSGHKGHVVVATHAPLEPLAIRAKNELNENSKLPAKVEVAPEWMHNDIVGYELGGDAGAVLELLDPEDLAGARLVEFMERAYRRLGAKIVRLEARGNSYLEKVMGLSLEVGLLSIAIARARGVDPAETRSIAEYKAVADEIFRGERAP